MGFWDKVNNVSSTPQKDAKSEALRKNEEVMRKGKKVESWFASGNCRPKVTNISFLSVDELLKINGLHKIFVNVARRANLLNAPKSQ